MGVLHSSSSHTSHLAIITPTSSAALDAWAVPHLLTVAIGEESTRVVLDTGEECCACELRLGTHRLRRTWQSAGEFTQQDVDAMSAWTSTLLQPLVEPFRRSRPVELTFTGEPTLTAALFLGDSILPAQGRHRISAKALAAWQARFDPEQTHTDATLEVLATVILMRTVLEAAKLDSAVVIGNSLS